MKNVLNITIYPVEQLLIYVFCAYRLDRSLVDISRLLYGGKFYCPLVRVTFRNPVQGYVDRCVWSCTAGS